MTDTTPADNLGDGFSDSVTSRQLRRGLILLIAFIAFRFILVQMFGTVSPSTNPVRYAGFLVVAILVGSVGLVYFGFTYWIGVDIVAWWVPSDHVGRHVLWGVGGFILSMLVTLSVAIPLQSVIGPAPTGTPASAPTLTGTILLLVFGFAVAAFQEETLFRGFLQAALIERFGSRSAIVLQSLAFAVAHIGYYPLSAWYLYGIAFLLGLVYGWLRHRRGNLLAPGIAHGLLG